MRAVIDQLPGSKIREVANAGLVSDDVLAFWFGESDEPTPQAIRDAALQSIRAGETFYSHNLGLPALREAIAGYVGSLHKPMTADRIAVTSSGVSALMIEFNTSCAPVFVQRAGLAALAGAADTVLPLIARLNCRDLLLPQLAALRGVTVATPPGGMYAFFRVAGEEDSLAFAKRLVVEAGLGLAPGAAFGAESEGWLRWCFASREPQRLTDGVARLRLALGL